MRLWLSSDTLPLEPCYLLIQWLRDRILGRHNYSSVFLTVLGYWRFFFKLLLVFLHKVSASFLLTGKSLELTIWRFINASANHRIYCISRIQSSSWITRQTFFSFPERFLNVEIQHSVFMNSLQADLRFYKRQSYNKLTYWMFFLHCLITHWSNLNCVCMKACFTNKPGQSDNW